MSNQELVAYDPEETLLPGIVNPYEDKIEDLMGSGGFLPRLQLFIAASDFVKRGKIPMNHYGLVTGKDQLEDLSHEVDILLICYRPRAIDTSDKENIRASSIIDSDLFREIQDRADNEKNSGCMYGPEYLVYIPQVQEFATILFGSKTARNEAKNAHQYVGKACTLKSKYIEGPKFSWQGMLVTACSTPFEIPVKETLIEQAKIFLDPKEVTGSEKVEEEVTTRAR